MRRRSRSCSISAARRRVRPALAPRAARRPWRLAGPSLLAVMGLALIAARVRLQRAEAEVDRLSRELDAARQASGPAAASGAPSRATAPAGAPPATALEATDLAYEYEQAAAPMDS